MRLASLILAALVTLSPAIAPAEEAAAPGSDRAGAPADAPVPATPSPEPAPIATPRAPANMPLEPAAGKPLKRFKFGCWGALPFGEKFYTAITPADASYQVNKPDTSWALGIVAQYRIASAYRVFVDGGLYRESVQVAKAGQTAGSFWVYEQTGYTTHSIGPFDKNARFYMDTTALRLGAAYAMPLGSFEAWVGATVGVYAWQATYGTDDRTSKWGQTSGTVTGLTLIMGADMPLDDALSVGLFADLASPVADGQMHDLFRAGWTWTVNHHVMGPYRIGLRLLF